MKISTTDLEKYLQFALDTSYEAGEILLKFQKKSELEPVED
jgi:hypothetical protein